MPRSLSACGDANTSGPGGSGGTTTATTGGGGSGGITTATTGGGGTGGTTTATTGGGGTGGVPDQFLTYECSGGFQYLGIAATDPDNVIALARLPKGKVIRWYFYTLFTGQVGTSSCDEYAHKVTLFFGGSAPSDNPSGLVDNAKGAQAGVPGEITIRLNHFNNPVEPFPNEYVYAGPRLSHQAAGDMASICVPMCPDPDKLHVAEALFSANGEAPYGFKTLSAWGINSSYVMGAYSGVDQPIDTLEIPDPAAPPPPPGLSNPFGAPRQLPTDPSLLFSVSKRNLAVQEVASVVDQTPEGFKGQGRVFGLLDAQGAPVTRLRARVTISEIQIPTRSN